MDEQIVRKNKINLVIAQVIGFVFGVAFTLSGDYGGFFMTIGSALLAGLAIAALLRFCVRVYQFAKLRFGLRLQEPDGSFVVVERPGRGVFAAIVVSFLLIGIGTCIKIEALKQIYFITIVVVGVLFCCLDIRWMIMHRKKKD